VHERDHLDHLPGRTYLGVVGVVAFGAVVVAAVQMITTSDALSVGLWGVVAVLGVVSLVSLAVAWEERRAHIHALVREILEADGRTAQQHAMAMAELVRLGAHREIELVNQHVIPPGKA
jgi:hypothetical protein